MGEAGHESSNLGDPRPIPALVAEAKSALEAGRFEDAERICHQLLALRPGFAPADYYLAVIDSRRGNRAAAIERLRRVVKANSSAFEATVLLADLLREQGELRESERLCEQMMRIRPDHPGALAATGSCLLELEKPSEALPYLEQAARLAPGSSAFQYSLATALGRLHQIDRSVAAYEEAIRLAPHAPQPYEELAFLLARNDRRREAIEILKRAAEAAPTLSSLGQLAAALVEDERFAESEPFARAAVALDPDSAPSYDLLGRVLQVLGRFDEAIECFQKAMELDPDLAAPIHRFAWARKITEADSALVARLEQMSHEDGRGRDDSRMIHYGLAKAYDDTGRYEEAMEQFAEANRLSQLIQNGGKPFDVARHQRWVDRQIETFDRRFFQAWRDLGNASQRPIFIVGMIQSGTTLTEQILSSHPRIEAGGEIKYWTRLARNELAQRVTEGALHPDELRSVATEYLELLDGVADRVTDKMPLNYLSLGLIHLLLPNAIIVHCRRRPIDTCLSIYMTPFQKGADFSYEPASIVAAYRAYERLMAHWRAVLPPSRFIEIDYEDLVADREPLIRRILSATGLEWDESCMQHERNLREVSTPSRWQVRQPIYATSVDRWKRYEPWLGEFRSLVDPPTRS